MEIFINMLNKILGFIAMPAPEIDMSEAHKCAEEYKQRRLEEKDVTGLLLPLNRHEIALRKIYEQCKSRKPRQRTICLGAIEKAMEEAGLYE